MRDAWDYHLVAGMPRSITQLLGCLGLSPGCWDVWDCHSVAGMSRTVAWMLECLGVSPGCWDAWGCHLDAGMLGRVTWMLGCLGLSPGRLLLLSLAKSPRVALRNFAQGVERGKEVGSRFSFSP